MFAAIWQGPPERLALDPEIHQGLRRKNQPGLVCSSTDYKGLGGFFYLPLWYGPNLECQFSPAPLGSISASFPFFFFVHISLRQTFAFLCFVFPFSIFGFCSSTCTFPADTFCFSFPCKTLTQRRHGTPLPCIKRTSDLHRLNIPRSVSAPVASGWTMERWPSSVFQPRQGAETTKTRFIPGHKNCTGCLFIQKKRHSRTTTSCLVQRKHTALKQKKGRGRNFQQKQELLRKVILLRLRRLSVCLKHFVLPRSRVLISPCFEETEKNPATREGLGLIFREWVNMWKWGKHFRQFV